MPVPARPRQRRSTSGAPSSPAVIPAVLVITALGAGAAAALAPAGARSWVLVAATVAWGCLTAVIIGASTLLRHARQQVAAQAEELEMTRNNWAQQGVEAAQLVHTTLPAVVQQVKNGADAAETLSGASSPSDPYMRQMLHVLVTEVGEAVRRVGSVQHELNMVRGQLIAGSAELEQLTHHTLPSAVTMLREGSSADTVLAAFEWPRNPLLRATAESFVRDLAHSERRSSAAQAASAKALSRVQAKTVSMLAELREMQERHGQEVFGDLLRLDHSTSQLGLMTDRLALLMGGRPSRVWNKPIVMESILRGAVGRIAAYRRVRLHNSSRAAIAGFAAEGVMHLLAELMDNAANFSPPIDEVHVYAEEGSAGLVVTIEDSGLKMSDAAMRRAEESVSGKVTDLASLQGTRLGLSVVGRLSDKYGISVNYRPSSRGGTGVVVLLPPELVAQQRGAISPEKTIPARQVPATHTSAVEEYPVPVRPQMVPAQEAAPAAEDAQRHSQATPHGLPVRAPGRTMAEAERSRSKQAADSPRSAGHAPGPARDAGSRFGAFHRGRKSSGATDSAPGSETGAGS
ncbi:ATP-binding protein [Streptomyces sp. NPDC085932]|uniref:ATP-binding protein n=1 Tax=Streptomyces sp. NPDC085932 TaxID=3365741 RepID=UPI0037D066DF